MQKVPERICETNATMCCLARYFYLPADPSCSYIGRAKSKPQIRQRRYELFIREDACVRACSSLYHRHQEHCLDRKHKKTVLLF